MYKLYLYDVTSRLDGSSNLFLARLLILYHVIVSQSRELPKKPVGLNEMKLN